MKIIPTNYSLVASFFSTLVFQVLQKPNLTSLNTFQIAYQRTLQQTEKILIEANSIKLPTKSILILALIYLSRVSKNSISLLGSENKLFGIATMVSQKYLLDKGLTQNNWGGLLNLDLRTLSKFEREFLDKINYDLNCNAEEFRFWELQVKNLGVEFYMNSCNLSDLSFYPIPNFDADSFKTNDNFYADPNFLHKNCFRDQLL
ncbi:hypothetical protein HDU92_000660 [Lobulomyces angularis]|nr:hypothetical protein HDU92_000660 [Lobulomyces angularis]